MTGCVPDGLRTRVVTGPGPHPSSLGPPDVVFEQIRRASARRYAEHRARVDAELAQFLAARPFHERVRVVIEEHMPAHPSFEPPDVTFRVRDWSEVTLEETTRVGQALTRIGLGADRPPGHTG